MFSHDDLGIEQVLVEPDTGRVTGVIDRNLRALAGDPVARHGTGPIRPWCGRESGASYRVHPPAIRQQIPRPRDPWSEGRYSVAGPRNDGFLVLSSLRVLSPRLCVSA